MTQPWPPLPPPVPAPSWEAKLYTPQVPPDALGREWKVPPHDGIVPLRPLGVGDILGGAFRAIRFNAPVMIGLTFAVVLVCQLVPALVAVASGSAALAGLQAFSNGNFDGLAESAESLVAVFGLSALASVVSSLVAQVFTVHGAYAGVTAKRPTAADTWRATARRIVPVIGYTLLLFAAMTVAIFALAFAVVLIGGAAGAAAAVAGVLGMLVAITYLAGRLMFTIPVIVVERRGVFRALGRSWRLSHGRGWRTVGLYLLTGFVIGLATQGVSTVFSLVAMPLTIWYDAVAVTLIASVVASVVASAISLPLLNAAITLIYVDARIRQEGLDITLSEELWS